MKKFLMLSCFLLSSCSTMKPQECIGANWHDIGYNDALQGRTLWIKSRTEACSKVNLKLNKSAYLTGYQKGSKQFCTYKNGYIYGRRNAIQTPICVSPALSKPFYAGYKEGLSDYEDARDRYERFFGGFGIFYD